MSIFSNVAGARTPKKKFNLSHEKKMSIGMGQLVPTFVEEVLPGDKFRVNQEIMARMAPMLAPIMHRIDVWTHYFFVPNRIVWDNWDKFISGGEDGLQQPLMPYIVMDDSARNSFIEGKMPDMLGVPTIPTEGDPVEISEKINALPFRAMLNIYNEYYRDQNVLEEIEFSKGDGDSSSETGRLSSIRRRAWARDYFTSAMPWSQRGPSTELPAQINYSQPARAYDDLDADAPAGNLDVGANAGLIGDNGNSTGPGGVRIENIESLGITVEDLRRSSRLQEWLERQARGGGRLTETILSHFGVLSKDQRLQRPEYLGGSKNPLSVSEVLNTTGITNPDDPQPTDAFGGDVQGAMAGHGVAVGSNRGFQRRFTEHGWVFGITSVMPKRNYQQGLSRKLSRFDKFDYYWPEFANIGEQEVLNKELYLDNSGLDNDDTFGYQSRYSEYKHACNTVHGAFRSSFNFWHLGDIFSTRPNLNNAFLECKPSERIFAVDTQNPEDNALEEQLYVQVHNHVSAVRPMPYQSRPNL